MKRVVRCNTLWVGILTVSLLLVAANARAGDKLLDEILSFNGAMLFLETRVPGLVIGAVRNGGYVYEGDPRRLRGQNRQAARSRP